MSSSIYLWDPERLGLPMPGTLPAVAEQFRQLLGKAAERNSAFVILADRIQSQVRILYGDDEELMASYGNLAQEAEQWRAAIFELDAPDDDMDLFRLIVECATRLELVVYLDSIGICFLPGGIALPAGVELPKAPPSNVPTGKAPFGKLINTALYEMFSPLGFDWGEPSDGFQQLVKNISGGVQYLKAHYGKNRDGLWEVGISGYVVYEAEQEILKKFDFVNNGYTCWVAFRQEGGELQYRIIKNQADLDFMWSACRKYHLRFMELSATLQGLDALMNGDEMPALREFIYQINIPSSLIVARLANNPCFEELVEILRQAGERWWGSMPPNRDKRAEFEKLVPYLRNEVAPLV